jgi:hypothetical protein
LKENLVPFSFKNIMAKHAHSIDLQVLRRIKGKGEGWVFTPSAFADLGSRTAVDLALMRQKRAGNIRQLTRGLYDYPRHHPKLGVLSPSPEAVAQALKGSEAIRLQPSGAYAANLLGLSEQVPVKVVFLTDGPSRRVLIGKQELILKRTTPRNMATAGTVSGLVIQALRNLGRKNINDTVVRTLRKRLTDKDKEQLIKDLRYAPAWIADIMRRIADPTKK